jgi:hypothetical protein
MGEHNGALLDVRPGHPEDDEDARFQEILDALRDLPAADQDAVRSRLAAVARNYERTRQVDPLIHFVESLLVTARLHRNPAYRKALAEADDAQAGAPADVVELGDFMSRMRERHS